MPLSTDLHWNLDGLLPAIVQELSTRQVLMLGWMNAQALRLTMTTGDVHFWSRSRQELWRKGQTSGNGLRVATVHYDCDADALLVQATAAGPTCHTGHASCFFRELTFEEALGLDNDAGRIAEVAGIIWPQEAAEGGDEPPGDSP